MRNILIHFTLFLIGLYATECFGQNVKFGKQTFELHNVTGSVIDFQGKKVLKIERDLKALPFYEKNLETTVYDLQ